MIKKFKICAISDTHNKHDSITIPECDILIHAGDATFGGQPNELRDFAEWMNEQEAGRIVYVPGNHELWLQQNLEIGKSILLKYCPGMDILIDQTIDIEGIKIHGSPATPFFHNWAWNYAKSDSEAALRNIEHIQKKWDLIPLNANILITHGPAYKVLDQNKEGEHCGDYNLMSTIIDLRPDLHVCGHIHEGHGHEHHDGIDFYNVSICNRAYLPLNPVTIIDYEFDSSEE